MSLGCDRRLLPIAKGTAEQGGGASFATEDDDVVFHREPGIPRSELEAARGDHRENPVVSGFFLNSTKTCEQVCGSHTSLLIPGVSVKLKRADSCNTLHIGNRMSNLHVGINPAQ